MIMPSVWEGFYVEVPNAFGDLHVSTPFHAHAVTGVATLPPLGLCKR